MFTRVFYAEMNYKYLTVTIETDIYPFTRYFQLLPPLSPAPISDDIIFRYTRIFTEWGIYGNPHVYDDFPIYGDFIMRVLTPLSIVTYSSMLLLRL